MIENDDILEARATKLLVAILIKELDNMAPGMNAKLDTYLVELLSRPGVEARDRDAIGTARHLLAGLQGR